MDLCVNTQLHLASQDHGVYPYPKSELSRLLLIIHYDQFSHGKKESTPSIT